jgi:hypothetical protein
VLMAIELGLMCASFDQIYIHWHFWRKFAPSI